MSACVIPYRRPSAARVSGGDWYTAVAAMLTRFNDSSADTLFAISRPICSRVTVAPNARAPSITRASYSTTQSGEMGDRPAFSRSKIIQNRVRNAGCSRRPSSISASDAFDTIISDSHGARSPRPYRASAACNWGPIIVSPP